MIDHATHTDQQLDTACLKQQFVSQQLQKRDIQKMRNTSRLPHRMTARQAEWLSQALELNLFICFAITLLGKRIVIENSLIKLRGEC